MCAMFSRVHFAGGTPFFIAGELPIQSEQSKTPFRRLMIAQDTGSAITGPARADLYADLGIETICPTTIGAEKVERFFEK